MLTRPMTSTERH